MPAFYSDVKPGSVNTVTYKKVGMIAAIEVAWTNVTSEEGFDF